MSVSTLPSATGTIVAQQLKTRQAIQEGYIVAWVVQHAHEVTGRPWGSYSVAAQVSYLICGRESADRVGPGYWTATDPWHATLFKTHEEASLAAAAYFPSRLDSNASVLDKLVSVPASARILRIRRQPPVEILEDLAI